MEPVLESHNFLDGRARDERPTPREATGVEDLDPSRAEGIGAMEELEHEIKQLIIDSLRLEDVQPADLKSEAPLFAEGLGLDSIDALELAVVIRRKYGVRTTADDRENAKIFANVKSLAAYVAAHRQAKA